MSATLTARGTPRKRNYPTNRSSRTAHPVERLWRYIEVDDNGCWNWTAHRRNGYGSIVIHGQTLYAHRVSYECHVGPISPELQLDHLCRNTRCCNPEHLEQVTPQVNMRRGESPGARARRREACLHGHPYDEYGVLRHGRRVCRLCNVVRSRIYHSMTRDEREARKAAGLPIADLAAYFTAQREDVAA